MGGLCPLFFDGAICRFEELPRPDDKVNMDKVYKYLKTLRTSSPVFLLVNNLKNKLQRKNKLSIFADYLKNKFKKWQRY